MWSSRLFSRVRPTPLLSGCPSRSLPCGSGMVSNRCVASGAGPSMTFSSSASSSWSAAEHGDGIHLWMRDESKPHERRCIFTPSTAKALMDAGYRVSVEKSSGLRCFDDSEYVDVGCEMVDTGSWRDAPRDAYVCGLKELPSGDSSPLVHRHILFCHVFKHQAGWASTLMRFERGGGTLYDLEFLVDEQGDRVAAFSYHAGLAGAAAALLHWGNRASGHWDDAPPLGHYETRASLVQEVAQAVGAAQETLGRAPSVLVLGALGRVGTGATDLIEEVRRAGQPVDVVQWDLALGGRVAQSPGPYWEILEHDVLINCIYLRGPAGVFLSRDMLDVPYPRRNLSVVGDVSCDTSSPHNPLPFCDQTTTFDNPSIRVAKSKLKQQPLPLDVIAIDHLPAMLPREASEYFSSRLLPSLMQLNQRGKVWERAEALFLQKKQQAKAAQSHE